MSIDFESARKKYRPKKLRYLLIAEAPPSGGRFFYFDDVPTGDSLFLETMKVLYPADCSDIKSVRMRKAQFLRRFQEDGFFLIDALDEPTPNRATPRQKQRQILAALPALLKKVEELLDENVKIILISANVFAVCAAALRKKGFSVLNDEQIEFPASGHQREYRQKLDPLLVKRGWRIRANRNVGTGNIEKRRVVTAGEGARQKTTLWGELIGGAE
jgi:hypothetical protein